MNKPGPKPTPTSILSIRGSWRATSRKDEPTVDPKLPGPPDDLLPEAVQYWDEYGRQAFNLGVMAEPFADALKLLCETRARYEQIKEAIKKDGRLTVSGTHGGIVLNPLLRIEATTRDAVTKLLCQFGMTASSMSGVSKLTGESKDKKGLDRFKRA